jgi:3-phosphoshikimate 1-carboxyvinyltransferase
MKNATDANRIHHAGDKKHPATGMASSGIRGEIHVPGDKSISHRALILASQALGVTQITGLLEGEDVMRTKQVLMQCGVPISNPSSGVWQVSGGGIGGLHAPDAPLDMGNAGTAARLLMGLFTPYPYRLKIIGDASLSRRPMRRVTQPLALSSASFHTSENGGLPLTMQGAQHPLPIDYSLPVASAQVKSAILLAGLNTPGITSVHEPVLCRDHTERMMGFFGIDLQIEPDAQTGRIIKLTGQQAQTYQDRTFSVPADPSSAAFLIVAALITPHSEITLRNICMNKLRIGLFDTLKQMQADITYHNQHEIAGEAVADITIRTSALEAITVPASRAASMIDEYPILAIAAAFAKGQTRMCGLQELRVKESNRLAAIIDGLHACGVDAIEEGDDLIVFGRGRAPKGGGHIACHHDHRIAMSFLVAAQYMQEPVSVDDISAIATSFPNFIKLMTDAGGVIHTDTTSIAATTADDRLVIAVDGPAASGKGTLARRLAEEFNLGYLDTGSLYRATGMRVLYAEKDPHDVVAAIAAAKSVQDHDLSNPKIRSERVGKAASIVSAIPEVRDILLAYQQDFAARAQGAVLDGRDIGTVICPNADFKFFITADIETRAKRRHKQLCEYGVEVAYESVKNDLLERDIRDSKRKAAPLKPANDAVVMDTTHLSANEAFADTLEHIRKTLLARD